MKKTVCGSVPVLCGALLLLAAGRAAAADAAAAPAGPPRWTLGDVIAIAVRNHPRVGLADAEARAVDARRGQVASVTYPQVNASAGAAWSENISPITGDPDRTTSTAVAGNVTQLVTDFGRTAATLTRADGLEAAAGESARGTRVDVVFLAQIAYFNVLRAESVLGVGRETVRQRETLHRQAQAFFDTGLKARIDVVRAEANLYQARADIASAEHEVRTARLVLLNSMGMDGPAEFDLAGGRWRGGGRPGGIGPSPGRRSGAARDRAHPDRAGWRRARPKSRAGTPSGCAR